MIPLSIALENFLVTKPRLISNTIEILRSISNGQKVVGLVSGGSCSGIVSQGFLFRLSQGTTLLKVCALHHTVSQSRFLDSKEKTATAGLVIGRDGNEMNFGQRNTNYPKSALRHILIFD